MYCNNCGSPCDDGAKFCSSCGAPVSAGNAPTPINTEDNAYQKAETPAYRAPEIPSAPAKTSAEIIKSIFSSPLFLTGTILQTLNLLLSVISSVSGIPTLNILSSSAAFPMLNTSSSVSTLVYILFFLIPSALVAAGLWISYGSAKNKECESINTVGLSMIKVIMIISLVLTCIIGLAMILVALSNAKNSNNHSLLPAAIAVVIALVVISILFFSRIVKSINNVKYSVSTKTASPEVSAFVAVIMFLFASITIMFFLLRVVHINVLSLISTLISAATLIIFGILVFKYRHRMVTLKLAEEPRWL